MEDDQTDANNAVFKSKFKVKRPKNPRTSIKTEDSDEEVEKVSSKLENLKEIQSLRKRPHGVSLAGLALGKKIAEDEVVSTEEKMGGLLKMNALKSGKIKQVDDAFDTGIGTQFSVETNKRDEDEEMMKYIEEELSKHKGNNSKPNEESTSTNKKAYLTPEEAALQAVPSHLRESTAKRSEEMLSNQMLSGIPEVDLGIEAKIKNIEATEEAKLKLLWESQNKKDCPSQFVPTNMAVNFVQHNRFNVQQTEQARKKQKVDVQEEEKPKKKTDKATDDYHFERFKKQFRR